MRSRRSRHVKPVRRPGQEALDAWQVLLQSLLGPFDDACMFCLGTLDLQEDCMHDPGTFGFMCNAHMCRCWD